MNKHYESKVRLHLQRSAGYLRHAEEHAEGHTEGQGAQHMKGFGSLWSEIQECWNTLHRKQLNSGRVSTSHDAEEVEMLKNDMTDIEHQEPVYNAIISTENAHTFMLKVAERFGNRSVSVTCPENNHKLKLVIGAQTLQSMHRQDYHEQMKIKFFYMSGGKIGNVKPEVQTFSTYGYEWADAPSWSVLKQGYLHEGKTAHVCLNEFSFFFNSSNTQEEYEKRCKRAKFKPHGIPEDYNEVMNSIPAKIHTDDQIAALLDHVKEHARLDWMNLGERLQVPSKMGVMAVNENGKKVYLSSGELSDARKVYLSSGELSDGQRGKITQQMRDYAKALVFSREFKVIDESRTKDKRQST